MSDRKVLRPNVLEMFNVKNQAKAGMGKKSMLSYAEVGKGGESSTNFFYQRYKTARSWGSLHYPLSED